MKKNIVLKRVLLTVIALIILVLVTTSYLTEKAVASKNKAEIVTYAFLLKASAGDYESAYDFMATPVKDQITYTKFKESLQYPQGIFSDVSSAELYDMRFMANIGGPTTMSYSGRVMYNDETTARLETTYIEENGELKIVSIYLFPDSERSKNVGFGDNRVTK